MNVKNYKARLHYRQRKVFLFCNDCQAWINHLSAKINDKRFLASECCVFRHGVIDLIKQLDSLDGIIDDSDVARSINWLLDTYTFIPSVVDNSNEYIYDAVKRCYEEYIAILRAFIEELVKYDGCHLSKFDDYYYEVIGE